MGNEKRDGGKYGDGDDGDDANQNQQICEHDTDKKGEFEGWAEGAVCPCMRGGSAQEGRGDAKPDALRIGPRRAHGSELRSRIRAGTNVALQRRTAGDWR